MWIANNWKDYEVLDTAAGEKLEYTQEEVAEKVGVKKSAVAKWENGRVSEIKRSNLKKLADALEIDPNQLLGDIEHDPVGVTYCTYGDFVVVAQHEGIYVIYHNVQEELKEHRPRK